MSNASGELFRRYAGNPIITACDLSYTANTVFNAGAIQVNGETVLLMRVEDRRGISNLTVARRWHQPLADRFAAHAAAPPGHPSRGAL